MNGSAMPNCREGRYLKEMPVGLASVRAGIGGAQGGAPSFTTRGDQLWTVYGR